MPEAVYSRPSDPSRDFCQWPYDSPTPPAIGALRQSAVLLHALEGCRSGSDLIALMGKIRAVFGRFNTVWGLKTTGDGVLGLELYFYDYDRTDRAISLAEAAQRLPELFPIGIGNLDQVPFFMWSIEVALDQPTPNGLDVYTDGFGGTASGGICHAWNGTTLELKNTYHFFETNSDLDEINNAMTASARTSPILPLPNWMAPRRWGEGIFVFAQKRHTDAIYLSRIRTDAAIALCQKTGFPPRVTDYLGDNRDALNHHLWDFGLDYEAVSGAPVLRKSGLYGLL
jgi:hypothetical protein